MRENKPKINQGHFLEEAVLGKVKTEYGHDFAGETQEQHENYSQETLFSAVKNYQPWDNPCKPENPFPKDLLETTAYLLGLPEDSRQLRYFTVVGSHLDLGAKKQATGV